MKNKPTLAKVESITPLTDSILQLVLAPERYIPYQAGQYLEIILNEEVYAYSIANAPLGSHKYELHIRHCPENSKTFHLLEYIKEQGAVTINLPLGDCHLNKLAPEIPILFIAGGTGFAPVKAMIEQLLATADKRVFELLWGARSESDLYMNEKIDQWQAHVQHFNYFALLSNRSKETLISKLLTRHKHDLLMWQYVIAGPFDMVFAIRDELVSRKVPSAHLFSDAFSFQSKE